jgi:hypothetical protein
VTANPNLDPESPATEAFTVTPRTKSAVKTVRSAAPPVTAPLRVAPPCTLDGSSAHNCQTQSRDWISMQVIDLWPYALLMLAALAGIWLAVVSLVSRWP